MPTFGARPASGASVPHRAAKLDLGRVVRETVRTCREQWRLLLVAGLIVFIPLGFVEALDASLQELDFDDLDDAAFLGVLAVAFGHAGSALLGEVFYAGVVAAGVSQTRRGAQPRLREIARTIPYGRLAVVDVQFALIAAVGLLLLVVPGFIFFVWFVLAGPVVEVEGRRPVAALRRSRELVRGSFWRVVAIVIPLELGTNLLVDVAGSAGHAVLGESFLAEWAGSALGGVVATPIWAATIVVLMYELRALRAPGEGAATEPQR